MTRRANHRPFLYLILEMGLVVATGLGAQRAVAQPPANEADKPAVAAATPSVTVEQVQEVLAQATALARRLEAQGNAERLQPLLVRLQELTQSLSPAEPGPAESARDLVGLHAQACQVARQIAFCNPLLDFDKLLFLKRHDSGGVYHMCDQFYGCNARPGGGLFVLENPWSDQPQVRNLLENSVVQNGRLQGQKLRFRDVPVARTVVRRADDSVCVQPGQGLGEVRRQGMLRVGAGVQLPHLPLRCGRSEPRAADRWRSGMISIRASCPTVGLRSFPNDAAGTCVAAVTARCTPCTR